MKIAERIVIVLLLFLLLGGGAWIYFAVMHERTELREAVARGEFEIRPEETPPQVVDETDWRDIYPVTIPITIGGVPVEASVADSLAERIKGLSGTPFLPENVVKLFAFGAAGNHSIWMKDMNYPIDIIWADEAGVIVHIEEAVSPDTYPTSFSSPIPAWYVVETKAGFVETHSVTLGDQILLPLE